MADTATALRGVFLIGSPENKNRCVMEEQKQQAFQEGPDYTRRRPLSTKFLMVGAMIFVLAVAGVASGYFLFQHRTPHTPQDTQSASEALPKTLPQTTDHEKAPRVHFFDDP